MSKPVSPMDDFWEQMFDALDNTTDEEWSQFIEDYERENRPMLEAIELCNQILELIENLGEPSFLRFDDISIVSSFGEYDCYGDKCSDMFVRIYQEEKLVLFIDKTTYYGVEYELIDRDVDKIFFLQHIVELLKLRLERDKHE